MQSNELGKVYLIKNDIDLSAGISVLNNTNETQWNEVTISAINTDTNLSALGLIEGSYNLHAVDVAGNISLPIEDVLKVENFAPKFRSSSQVTFAENGTGVVYIAQATPDVGGAVSYSISGGADSIKFSIDSSSGVVRFISSPNHESPTDSGSGNVYDIVIRATEANNTHTVTRSVAVTVTDVGDSAPTFTSASSATFAENGTGAVYTAVVSSDVAGAAVTFAISGGADSAKFSINSSSGVVGFVSSPNHESPTDSGSNNVYNLVITATEAGNTNTVTQSVAVTVTDVGDLAPTFSSASSATFAENGNGAVYTAQATPDVTGAVVSYSISGGADSAKFSIDSSSGVVSFVSVPTLRPLPAR